MVDLEAELLASQRFVGALQKETKLWRSSSQPTTPSTGNTPTNAGDKSGKKVHFRFSPPSGSMNPDDLAAMEPFQAILLLLDQLEATNPLEKDRLQTYLRNNQRERYIFHHFFPFSRER